MNKKFQDLINSEKPTLIDFYAEWCQPCQMMKPILAELKKKIGDTASVIKIDTEKNRELSGQLNIMSIPTLMIYHKGELKWRHSGMASVNEIEHQLSIIK
jgi:thioredoxin 1